MEFQSRPSLSRLTRPELEFSFLSSFLLVFLLYMRENTFNRKDLSPVAEDGRATAYQTNALNQYTAITEEGAAPFHPTYDANGNQTLIQTDTGIWAVDYDFFNQPIKFTRGTTLITCGYDYMGRRWFRKITENGTVIKHERYLYRGYQQIATVDLMQPQPTVRHVIIWDPSEPTATRPLALLAGGQLYLYGLDFSKNVTELMDSATGTLAATYDYSPFGALTSSGGLAAVNPLQWSSEVYDPATALVYYNYRHLNTRDGRWISRDRIAERGSMNLYNYCLNNAIVYIDWLGLAYSNQSAAARAAIQQWSSASIRDDKEYCGMICKKKGTTEFIYTSVTGAIASCQPDDAACPDCYVEVAYWHTHGAFIDNDGDGEDDRYFTEVFSAADLNYATSNDIDGYLGTPLGKMLMYDHNRDRIIPKRNWR